jgi:hypothetical protein
MKRPEIRQELDVAIQPLRKEDVVLSAIKDFRSLYSQKLLRAVLDSGNKAFDVDVAEEHQHILHCIRALTEYDGEYTVKNRVNMWWCAEDLTIHLNKYHLDFVEDNQDLLPLLGAIQRLVEPSDPELSKKDRREQLYLQWHRAQIELRNRISMPNDRNQLGISARAVAISEALITPEPSLEKLSQANRAARDLLSLITDTQDTVLLEIRELLQKIEKTTRLEERKGAQPEAQEEADVYDLFTEYQTLFREKLVAWFLQEIFNSENSDEHRQAASTALVSAATIYLFIQDLKKKQRNAFASYSDRNKFLDAIEGVFDYCDGWGGPDFLDMLSTNLAEMKEEIEQEAERIHTETHKLSI